MKQWLIMLAGLIVWAAHFFGVYLAASIFPGSPVSRWAIAVMTLIAMICVAGLLKQSIKLAQKERGDTLDNWTARVATMTNILALCAVSYQALPIMFA
jgi:divalent metal cation (Fe/Co/Zn/Cd) transporter